MSGGVQLSNERFVERTVKFVHVNAVKQLEMITRRQELLVLLVVLLARALHASFESALLDSEAVEPVHLPSRNSVRSAHLRLPTHIFSAPRTAQVFCDSADRLALSSIDETLCSRLERIHVENRPSQPENVPAVEIQNEEAPASVVLNNEDRPHDVFARWSGLVVFVLTGISCFCVSWLVEAKLMQNSKLEKLKVHQREGVMSEDEYVQRLIDRGDFAAAETELESHVSHALVRRTNNPVSGESTAWIMHLLALVKLELGKVDEAASLLEAVLEHYLMFKDTDTIVALSDIAEVLRRQHRDAERESAVDQAADIGVVHDLVEQVQQLHSAMMMNNEQQRHVSEDGDGDGDDVSADVKKSPADVLFAHRVSFFGEVVSEMAKRQSANVPVHVNLFGEADADDEEVEGDGDVNRKDAHADVLVSTDAAEQEQRQLDENCVNGFHDTATTTPVMQQPQPIAKKTVASPQRQTDRAEALKKMR